MISIEFFAKQMTRLKEKWGDRMYAGETMTQLYPIVQKNNENDFAVWVGYQLASARRAPLAEEFRDFVRSSFKIVTSQALHNLKNLPEENWKTWNPNCSKCQDTGNLTAFNKKNKNIYSFVCDCPTGQTLDVSSLVPRWRYFKEKDEYDLGG